MIRLEGRGRGGAATGSHLTFEGHRNSLDHILGRMGNFQKPRVRKSDSGCGYREPMGYCAVRLGSRMFFHLWS